MSKISKNIAKRLFKDHFEWLALLSGLIILGMMNPYLDNGTTWCLLEQAGVSFCPGDGLGHSIAYSFRGDFSNALEAHIVGPAAILIIAGRVLYLLRKYFEKKKK